MKRRSPEPLAVASGRAAASDSFPKGQLEVRFDVRCRWSRRSTLMPLNTLFSQSWRSLSALVPADRLLSRAALHVNVAVFLDGGGRRDAPPAPLWVQRRLGLFSVLSSVTVGCH